jgi:hypothetical protein
MKLLPSIALVVCMSVLVPASAEAPSPEQEAMRGSLYGLGEGLAAGVVSRGRPSRTERFRTTIGANFAGEKLYFDVKGLRVVVLRSSHPDLMIPVSVAVTTPQMLRLINHDFPEMTRSAIIGNYGPPASETANSLHYNGLAEICSDSIDIGLKNEKVIALEWTFCAD